MQRFAIKNNMDVKVHTYKVKNNMEVQVHTYGKGFQLKTIQG